MLWRFYHYYSNEDFTNSWITLVVVSDVNPDLKSNLKLVEVIVDVATELKPFYIRLCGTIPALKSTEGGGILIPTLDVSLALKI